MAERDLFLQSPPGQFVQHASGARLHRSRLVSLLSACRRADIFRAVLCLTALSLAPLSPAARLARLVEAGDGFPAPDEWPCFRRNGSLDARSPGRGSIREPRIAWRVFTGKLETTLVVEPGEGSEVVPLPRDELEPSRAPSLDGFFPAPAGEGNGGSPDVTFADAIAEEPGKEKIEFESAFSKATVNGRWQDCVGRCFARRGGEWVKVWETERIPLLFQALPLAGDFDGDGALEVAILPFHEVLLLDARTGRIKDRCRFTDTRSYGYFGAHDLDRDGRLELLVQADFSKHVDVLGVREGKLSVLWQKLVEPDISDPRKILRAGPEPVADVDGDGRPEILTSIFNDSGDEKWHIIAHDALTGRPKADLAEECLAAPLDVDGDGASELLTVEAHGAGLPDLGGIRVRSILGGAATTLWEEPSAAWATWEPPLPENVQSTATFGRRTVISRRRAGAVEVVVRRSAALSVLRWEAGRFTPVAGAAGDGLDDLAAFALDAAGRLLLRCRHDPERPAAIHGTRGRAAIHSTRRAGGSPCTVSVAWPRGAEEPTLIAQGAGEELVLFHPPRPPIEAAVRRLEGRGQSTSWPEARGPVVADLGGDGRRQILLATAAPSGCARIAARDLGGGERWHHDFPSIPGAPPVWNTGGMVLWQAGSFTAQGKEDVLATVRRSMMHSEETCLLSGADGRELWRRDREIRQRGVGGTPFAIADFHRDGLDDAASLYPSILYVLKGSTGRDLLAMDAEWPQVPAKPVYWGLPIAIDLEGEARPAIFFAGRSMTGLVRADGSLAWWDALDASPQDWPAFGDFDGDGRLEAIGVGYADGVRCHDAATGAIEWRMAPPSPSPPTGCASADLDGDGRDEAVFALGSRLACLGAARDGKSGELRWTLDLPALAGPPSLAALERGGPLCVLVAGADGWVYCVR